MFIIYSLFFIKIFCNEGFLQYPEPPSGWEEGICSSLNTQSPIDIPPVFTESVIIDDGSHAEILSTDYKLLTSGKVKFDGGHKWTTEELDAGTLKIKLNGTEFTYNLHSIHFHLYSEHRLQHKQYPMEMHMVHKNINETDYENKYLVVAILYDYSKDMKSDFLERMQLSKEKTINSADIQSLFNKMSPFFYYKGSLTTTPCTENVNWIVMHKVRDMSYQQHKNFEKWVRDSGKGFYDTGYGNARGPKPLNGREIYFENSPKDISTNYLLLGIPILAFICYPIIAFLVGKAKSE